MMLEFAPICVSFVISLLVSLILLRLSFVFSSNSSHLFSKIINLVLEMEKEIIFNILFLIIIYSFIFFIPLPKEILHYKLPILLILGGSSGIYFLLMAETYNRKYIFLTSFFLSTMSVCLYLHKTNVAFLFVMIYLTVFFLPIDLVFQFLLVGRVFSFPEWGFALMMQLFFLYGMKKWRVNHILSLFFFLILTSWFPQDPNLIAKYILFPFSGANAIFFLFKAKSGKEHFFAYLFYFINGINLCFLFNNKEAALYFLSLNILLLFILAYKTYIEIDKHNQPLSQFPSESLLLISKAKEQFLLRFYTVIFVMLAFYSYAKWSTDWAMSLILQVWFIPFYNFFMYTKEKRERIDEESLTKKRE